MPPFNALGLVLMSAATRDMEDRARAAQLSVLGGLLGGNMAGVVLLAAAANQGRLAPGGPQVATLARVEAPGRVQVPELPDDAEEAQGVLRSRGLVPSLTRVTSDEPIDGVIGSDPSPDAIVPRGSTVTVLVSGGLEVPKVVGEHVDAASTTVKEAGFEPDIRVSDKTGREDVVERQEPEGGTYADANSR